jgi:putative endonuclease
MGLFSAILGRLGLRPTLGRRGESIAARHLKKQGYRILGRNLKSSAGEIDVLAEAPDGRTIVVVEVKSAGYAGENAVRPEVHVNGGKQRKLASLASLAVKRYRLENRPVRFDVIGVDFPADAPPVVRHHVGAFQSNI